MISLVLWDLGDVLCHFRPERRLEAIAQRSGASIGEVERVLTSDVRRRLDTGDVSSQQLLELVQRELGWSCTTLELGSAWAAAFEPDERVLALARRLVTRAAVLTNNGPPLSTLYEQVLPSVAEVVPSVRFSGLTRLTKPDPQAFLQACRAMNTPAGETLLIDDSSDNVASAAAVGMVVHHHRTAVALEHCLTHHGLLAPP